MFKRHTLGKEKAIKVDYVLTDPRKADGVRNSVSFFNPT